MIEWMVTPGRDAGYANEFMKVWTMVDFVKLMEREEELRFQVWAFL